MQLSCYSKTQSALPQRTKRGDASRSAAAPKAGVASLDADVPSASSQAAAVVAAVGAASEQLLPLLLPVACGRDALLAAVAISALRALAAAHVAAFGTAPKVTPTTTSYPPAAVQ